MSDHQVSSPTDRGLQRGTLHGPEEVPDEGEQFIHLVEAGGVVVEEILSGPGVVPTDYDQDTGEWVVVLQGEAVLDVDGAQTELTAGDWLWLPAHTPHRVESVAPGTRWLAVHVPG